MNGWLLGTTFNYGPNHRQKKSISNLPWSESEGDELEVEDPEKMDERSDVSTIAPKS